MVFTAIASRIGLLEILAPPPTTKAPQKQSPTNSDNQTANSIDSNSSMTRRGDIDTEGSSSSNNNNNNNNGESIKNHETATAATTTATDDEQSASFMNCMTSTDEDEALARKLQEEENVRLRRLQTQRDAERMGASQGIFVKKQRVQYHHKSTNSYHHAVVVGVHFDDGPDRPYYTIKYKRQEKSENGEGIVHEIEKQTDPDRLERLPWDEDATWELLK